MFTFCPAVLYHWGMDDAGFGNSKINISQRRYLGSKTKLLSFIEEIVEKEKLVYSSFLDIFSGTGVVAHHFHAQANIIVNDILESNYLAYLAFFGRQKIRTRYLEGKIKQYNNLSSKDCPPNYFSENFTGTYFNADNSLLIGHIRDNIEELHGKGEINARERAYLVTALIYSLDKIANTVGHYDAYRRVAIPERSIFIQHLNVSQSKHKAYIFKKDANELAKEIEADITYIDPPYNSRQYSDAYHLLENIACWNKEPVFGAAKKINRDHIKSRYSMKTAGYAFSDLIGSLNTKYILVSYNDMGKSGDPRSQSRISDHELISALERKGEVRVYEKPFKQFSTGKSSRGDLKERIFFCKVKKIAPKNNISINRSDKNSNADVFVKSPLNYTGGKYKLLPQITRYFPKQINNFYDVFCGAANVGLNAKAQRVVCIDKSREVIALLNFLKSKNFEELHQEIEGVISKYGLSRSYINGYGFYGAESSKGLGAANKEAYLSLRSGYNSAKGPKKALLLLVLVLYGFNNQLRFNIKGEFNLPVGKRDYNGNSRKNIEGFNSTANAKNIDFKVGDFKDILECTFSSNDFVYLDPPYFLGLATYNENGGWTQKNEEELYAVLDKLNSRGVRFALSNVTEHKGETNTLLINWARENGYAMHNLSYSYKNSNYQSRARHGVTKEVLITNY